MAKTTKPLRQKQRKIASAMREHGKASIPQGGVRKAKIDAEVKFAKERAGGKTLAKKVKEQGGGDYQGMLKMKRSESKSTKKYRL